MGYRIYPGFRVWSLGLVVVLCRVVTQEVWCTSPYVAASYALLNEELKLNKCLLWVASSLTNLGEKQRSLELASRVGLGFRV